MDATGGRTGIRARPSVSGSSSRSGVSTTSSRSSLTTSTRRVPPTSTSASLRSTKLETRKAGTSSVKRTEKREDERVESDLVKKKWHGPDRLSKKFDALKTSDPFAKTKFATNFSFVYSQGGIPCRINHGVVLSKLQWDEDPATLDYDPLLVTVSDGLKETKHPFVFVAQTAFKEMLEAPNAAAKCVPLLPQIVRNLRSAMMSKVDGPFSAALNAIQQLSACVGEALNEHMGVLLIQINKKSFDRKYKTAIFNTLLALDENGGANATKIIKSKVPCFSR